MWTTNNRTIKISSIMPEDGWVFAKWWPATKTPEEAKDLVWSINLNVDKCNTFNYIKSDD